MFIYLIQQPEVPNWGDYSDVLLGGIGRRNEIGSLELIRTGPFIPPIALATGLETALVVTNEFRTLLLESGLSGLSFQLIGALEIVYSDWEHWNINDPEPQEYPVRGEPEDYLLGKHFSPELVAQASDMWEVLLEPHATLTPYQGVVDWDSTDWFHVQGLPGNYVSERAKSWLELTARAWIGFKQIALKQL